MDSYIESIKEFLLKRAGKNLDIDGKTRLYCKQPENGSDAWLHSVFYPLLEFDILERELQTTLPVLYREFLSECNGMILYSSSLYFYGFRSSYDREGLESWQPYGLEIPNVDERISDATDDMFFIGGYNWDGSLLYIRGEELSVYRCSRESVEPLNKWGNLKEMLIQEVERIDALFDLNGYELDEDTPTIPS